MIVLHVPNHRLHRLASLQPLLFQLRHRLDATPVHYPYARVVRIHAPIAQIHVGLFDGFAAGGDERVRLPDLSGQRVPIKGITGEAFGPHDQALFVRDRQAHLHAKLVAVSGLALADAFHLGGVQCVEFVLVVVLLYADAISALQKRAE